MNRGLTVKKYVTTFRVDENVQYLSYGSGYVSDTFVKIYQTVHLNRCIFFVCNTLNSNC